MRAKIVVECALEALSIYGDSMKDAMVLHLEKEGVSFVPEEFEIIKFCTALESMLGSWSEFICMKMIDAICKNTGASLDELGLAYSAKHLPYSIVLKELVAKVGKA
jgi:hypothetical protein